MKSFLKSLLPLFIILVFSHHALAADRVKIGVMDMQKFQQKSRTFQKTRAGLKTKFDALQRKLDDEKNAILKIEEDLKKQSMMLSLDAQEDKRRDLEKKQRYYKYLYEDLAQEMKTAEQEVTKRVGTDLEKIVKKIAEKDGYTVIIEKRTFGLVYYDDAIDLSDQVTEAYDKMNP